MNEDRIFIIGVEIANFKRIDLVRIMPHETGITIIGGENAQGKSSLIDGTMAALGGAKVLPDRPLRDGKESGHAIVDLRNGLVVERTFNTTKKGGDLIVKTKDGNEIKGAQTALDDPFGGIGFDPVRFIDVKNPKEEREQMQQLRDALGLDFTQLDCDKENAFSERKNVNSEIKRLEGKLASSQQYPDAPKQEISLTELTKEYEDATANNRRIDVLTEDRESAIRRCEKIEIQIKALLDEQKILKKDIELYDSDLNELTEIDLTTIKTKMSTIEEDNRKVRANHDYEITSIELAEKIEVSERLTADLKKIEKDKRKMVENANIPIDGLDFGEEGLLYNGVPLRQASSAEQIKVAIALADILNPKSRVILIRQGSNLDHKMLRHIAELANARGLQVIMERVAFFDDDGNEIGVKSDYLIEDGKVKNTETKHQTETTSRRRSGRSRRK